MSKEKSGLTARVLLPNFYLSDLHAELASLCKQQNAAAAREELACVIRAEIAKGWWPDDPLATALLAHWLMGKTEHDLWSTRFKRKRDLAGILADGTRRPGRFRQAVS